MKYFANSIGWIGAMLGIVVCAWLLQKLLDNTMQKEGFRAEDTVEPEERMSAQVFSYNLLQAVKGPIKRLSAQLLDVGSWKERMELVTLSPVELARRNLQKARA
jgi:hypothetical protein